jgi:hypothetical protein
LPESLDLLLKLSASGRDVSTARRIDRSARWIKAHQSLYSVGATQVIGVSYEVSERI